MAEQIIESNGSTGSTSEEEKRKKEEYDEWVAHLRGVIDDEAYAGSNPVPNFFSRKSPNKKK